MVARQGEDPEGSVASSMVEICVLRLPVALVEMTGMERVPGSPGPANIFSKEVVSWRASPAVAFSLVELSFKG